MGAAAELAAIFAEADNADDVAVFLREFHLGAKALSFLDRQDLSFLFDAFLNFFIDDSLNAKKVFFLNFGKGGEIEAEIVLVDVRTLLIDMGSKHFAKRGVQQMGRRVVPRGEPPLLLVDDEVDFVPRFQTAEI